MPPKKAAARPAQENISLGPQVREGELVFGGMSLRRDQRIIKDRDTR